ncbi:MAG: amidophosphoribosyltransferase, partial [Alphaproteobacteria bacterium]|nr:amidophosphoribosyltransferase [Alphaproteobacteria bacterium]
MLTTGRADADRFHEECGVFGIYGHPDAAALTALGLHALQHRGQEAAGIVAYDGSQFNAHRGPGLVGDNFGSKEVIDRLPGNIAIGHVRYATTGEVAQRNIQPLFADFEFGGLAICHNGNLTNSYQLRRQLVRRGSLFQSTSDTEVIVHLIATSLKSTVVDRLVDALRQVEGAYSLVALSQDSVIGLRDPLGVRPLVLGRLADAWIVTSETCALDIIGAEFVRDVEPGEIVTIDANGVKSLKPFADTPSRLCVFEYIYFARPDSVVEGHSVYEARKRIGRELAREAPVEADIIVPVPDSGVPAALGYAAESGIPFELGIIRNHYVGRTFIEPTDQIRHLGVRLKHNANRADLEGKRVVLVDDSIVRGTTSTKIVEMVRHAGASDVHMRISSPPTTHPCFYGIATPSRDQLLAAQ